jgi:hypothetical protein
MEEPMRFSYILAALVALGAASPALAEEYYIVKEKDGKTCTIVREKPTTETMVLVDEDGEVYATEVEAQEAVKKIKVCTVEED